MITIHKKPLSVGENAIELPIGSKVVDFKEKHGELFAWVLLDTSAETETRDFEVVKTGYPINGRYCGTSYGANRNTLHLIEV